MLEDAPLAYQSVDEHGTVREVNDAWLRLLGYDRQEVVGRPVEQFVVEAPLIADKESSAAKAITLIRKNGTRTTATIDRWSNRSAVGEGILFHSIFRSTTDLPRRPPRLRAIEESLREAELSGGIGSWEHDFRTGAISWSEGMYRLFGRTRANGPPEFAEEVHWYKDNTAAFRDVVDQALERGERSEAMFEVMLSDGRRRWHRYVINPYYDSDGNVARLFGIVQDVTAQKQSERQLSELHELLIRRNLEFEGVSKDLFILSPRELQICGELRKGHTSKEIAKRMGISPRSVETHRRNIRRKLQLKGKNLVVYLQMVMDQY